MKKEKDANDPKVDLWHQKVKEKLSELKLCKYCGRPAVYNMDVCAECFREKPRR